MSGIGVLLDELLRQQHGVASLQQLRDAGLTTDRLRAQLDAKRWQRVHRATYATWSGPLTRPAQLWAAVLACGPGSALSHESAAECHGLIDASRSRLVHVTVPVERRVAALADIRVHYLHRLPEVRHPSRVPPQVTVEATVLGLTDASRTAGDAMTWVMRALQRRLTTPDRLATAVAERRKMRWRDSITDALSDAAAGVHSLLEQRYTQQVERAHGLPRGERQAEGILDGGRVWRDVEYRRYRTLVELDGRLGHEREGRLRDLRRDNAATVDGNNTLRFGWFDLADHPCMAAQQVAVLLRRNGWAGTPRSCGRACTLVWPPPELIMSIRRGSSTATST